uniref:Uncharacterized protein n=1 Tax=Candidatus Kentrum sp. UNK TaxID=2126344 RepID=A0A451A7X7_9GAMM|nr:MAG: hypothetical protein BECKUNK1418G_GA0071005_10229 [Candidatus Kentron sp. UNK]
MTNINQNNGNVFALRAKTDRGVGFDVRVRFPGIFLSSILEL